MAGNSRAVVAWMAVAVLAMASWSVLGTASTAQPEGSDEGRVLFQRDCAVCHGPEGRGTERGPGLERSGTALVHFMLTTGRMPIDHPEEPIQRRPPAYAEDQIEAIVAHTATLTRGPSVPEVEIDPTLQARGGNLFRLHCAACHQLAGTGGVLVDLEVAPALDQATAQQTVEAIRGGPGTMPAYSEAQIGAEDADAIAAYVTLALRQPADPGGLSLGHFGPWSEGFIAWLVGVGGLLAVAAWIGRRT